MNLLENNPKVDGQSTNQIKNISHFINSKTDNKKSKSIIRQDNKNITQNHQNMNSSKTANF